MIIRKVIKHGNSLAIVIPASWCRGLDITPGTHVYLEVGVGDMILIAKIPPIKVEEIKKNNSNEE